MKILHLIIVTLSSAISFSQETTYPFIKHDKNYFLLWQFNQSYEKLFEKFNRLHIIGNEQIRILHIGDSHVQADIFTNQIRRQFAGQFFHLVSPPAIGFPYHIVNANQPVTIKVLCTGNWHGYTSNSKDNTTFLGFDAVTSDSCAHKIMIELNTKALQNISFNSLKIFCSNPNYINIKNPLIKNFTQQNINDSIYVCTFKLSKYVDSLILQTSLDTSAKIFKLYGIIPENDDPGIVYHILGINGSKASTYVRTLLADFVAFYRYDWLIISLGTNDVYSTKIDSSAIIQNFKELIRRIRSASPDIPILLTTPMEHYFNKRELNNHVEFVRDVIFSVAQTEGCAVWDFYDIAGGKGSADWWYRLGLTKPDKLHLTTEGYHLMGNLFFEAFMNTYVNGFLSK